MSKVPSLYENKYICQSFLRKLKRHLLETKTPTHTVKILYHYSLQSKYFSYTKKVLFFKFFFMTGLILLWVLVVWVLYGIAKYNGIITLKNNRVNAFSDIDVQLKLRFDLVDNLVNTVKGYATHEKDTLENITKARTSFLNAGSDINEKIDASNMLTSSLKSLFAVSENYPDLKANQNFLELQRELSDIENKIAASRRFFNSATKEYNTYIEMFPGNIIAGIFHFKVEKSFEVENEEERKVQKVQF